MTLTWKSILAVVFVVAVLFLLDALEANGVVSPCGHNGSREVLAAKPAAASA